MKNCVANVTEEKKTKHKITVGEATVRKKRRRIEKIDKLYMKIKDTRNDRNKMYRKKIENGSH